MNWLADILNTYAWAVFAGDSGDPVLFGREMQTYPDEATLKRLGEEEKLPVFTHARPPVIECPQ